MAPAGAVALSIAAGATYAGGALPLAVLLALIACLLVATSIGQLAKHLPSAGSIYTYPAEAIHPALGAARARACRGPPGHPKTRGGRVHRLPRVPVRHPWFLPQARVPPAAMAGRAGTLLRRGRLRGLQHDERPERVHGHRHPEKLGRDGLLVGGRYDECTPGHLEEMHSRIAGSQLAIIEDASHLCFAEQPAQFNDIINEFMDRTIPASPT
jgi:pimeloyl-ACP methyl ester carboxylesterase